MQYQQISFCKQDIMSVCIADSRARQEECLFYAKSCHTDRCMHFVFDEYCDCLKAQMFSNQAGVYLGTGQDVH